MNTRGRGSAWRLLNAVVLLSLILVLLQVAEAERLHLRPVGLANQDAEVGLRPGTVAVEVEIADGRSERGGVTQAHPAATRGTASTRPQSPP